MKSTSRGYRQATRWAVCSLIFILFTTRLSVDFLRAEESGKRAIVLFEFSQKGIEEPSAKSYFGELKKFIRDELALLPLETSSMGIRVDGKVNLPLLPANKVFLFREKLRKGRIYFNNLEIEKGARELEDLIKAPYEYRLAGKSLELVNEAILSYSFILFKMGKKELSGRLTSRYIYLSGAKEISEQVYPPDFTSFFNEISAKDRFVTLAVNTTPSGARVHLYRENMGNTPLVKKVRKFGPISVTVSKEGYVDHRFHRVAFPGDRLNFDLDLEIDEISQVVSDVNGGDYEGVANGIINLNVRMNTAAGLAWVLKGNGNSRSIDYVLVAKKGEGQKWEFSIQRDIQKKGPAFDDADLKPLLHDPLFLSIVPDRGKAGLLAEGLMKKKLTEKWWFWAFVGIGTAGIVYAIVKGRENKSGSSVNIAF
jgi:hypothetical protein